MCVAVIGVVSWLCAATASAQIAVDSLGGPVTVNEIATFKAYMQTRSFSNDNIGNDWVYGNQGTDMEALGLMYEITRDTAILDRMIQYADKALSIRNHATTGRLIWTGRRELCWPNKEMTAEDARYCGSENGDVVGHIAYCAKLILQTPALWSQAVTVGDPHGHGATYKARAQKYVTEMDRTLDTFMTPSFVKASAANHYVWPDTDAYGALGTRYEGARGKAIPWNQQTMISNGYLRLAECHEVLGDDAARVSRYYNYVRSNIQWFLSDLKPYTHEGFGVYDWGYSLGRTAEDSGHGGYDMWGLCRAYDRGNNAISRTTMVSFADTLAFVMYDETTNSYFQRVNGTMGGDANRSYVGASWMCLSQYRTSPRDLYTITASSNRSRAATRPLDAAYIFVNKHRRNGGTPNPTPTPTPAPGGYYRIMSRHSGKAVVVAGAATANAADVIQWTYGGSATNDEWQLVDLGNGYHRIVNRHSGKVLNVAGASTANGANVDQWSWANANQQQWQITDLGTGYHRLTARHSGKVLNVSGASTADGANVDQWGWTNVAQQQFQLLGVP
jgi:hypothetical protein